MLLKTSALLASLFALSVAGNAYADTFYYGDDFAKNTAKTGTKIDDFMKKNPGLWYADFYKVPKVDGALRATNFYATSLVSPLGDVMNSTSSKPAFTHITYEDAKQNHLWNIEDSYTHGRVEYAYNAENDSTDGSKITGNSSPLKAIEFDYVTKVSKNTSDASKINVDVTLNVTNGGVDSVSGNNLKIKDGIKSTYTYHKEVDQNKCDRTFMGNPNGKKFCDFIPMTFILKTNEKSGVYMPPILNVVLNMGGKELYAFKDKQ